MRSPEPVGALCRACAAALVIAGRRAPGIVATREGATPAAWMIDAWGQLHAIPNPCRIGRDRGRCDLSIADLSVSAEHAELRRGRDGWRVRDRGSSNGTGVGARARIRDAALPHRSRVWFGSIAFLFWGEPTPPTSPVPPPEVRTIVPAGAGYRLVGPGGSSATVRAARGHPLARAPGELAYRASAGAPVRRAPLPRLQFQLLRALCEAALGAARDERSGCVGTHELLALLPFRSASPRPNHVRQVVATLRATLARAGLAGGGDAGDEAVIAAHERLGYRVTWSVEAIEPERE